jgi:hypothetical protein
MKLAAPIGWGTLGAGLCAIAVFALTEGTSRDLDDAPVGVAAAPAGTPGELKLDAKEMARADVRVAAVVASQASAERTGFARALDVGALAAIDAEARAADATAAASRAEAARLATLAAQDQSASRRSVEAARAQALADAARAQLAARRVGLEFGPGLARLGRGGVSALVGDIAAGRAALVRVDIANVTLAPGAVVRIGEGSGAASVRVLGPAASADLKLQSAGVLAIARGSAAQGLLAGRVLPAAVAGGPGQTGVVVPRDAIVRYQGTLWVYVRKADGRFDRIELIDARPVAEGWFAPSGLKPGSIVAVSGAGSLMAMERGGEAAGDDDE